MATYSCRLYQNTGFNAVNIPDGPALLERCAHFDVNALDIMQDKFLSNIRVRATWDQVKEADYIKLGTSDPDYYFISSVAMLAKDVAEFTVLYDFITSVGGVSGIRVLDGITSRVHVTDDGFGKYCEADPLTAPAQPLELQTVWFNPSTNAHTYVEATVDLPRTAGTQKGDYFEYEGEGVVVPALETIPAEKFTTYKLADVEAGVNPHTTLYDLNDTTTAPGQDGWDNPTAINKGITKVRELGIEQGAIINQVQIPIVYAEATQTNLDIASFAYEEGGQAKVRNIVDKTITVFSGKKGFASSNLNYAYTGARNNRVNYGEYTPYGLISCSGESCEYKAEDIKDPENATAPVMKYIADPHTDGKPYFRWRYVNGESSDIGFFRNCITGLQWKQVPLFFNDPSGTAINTMRYNNSREMAAIDYNNTMKQADYNMYRSQANGIFSMATGGLETRVGDYVDVTNKKTGKVTHGVRRGSHLEDNYAGLSSGFMDVVTAPADWYVNRDILDSAYARQKINEYAEYRVNNYISAPTINFPYNSEVMRDFFGNGCLMYRYKYSSADINRIDKLLSMYGYKYTKALESADFTSKTNYNYVECSNVTVTGHPKYMCDGIGMMLRNGVRVWHVLPDPALYTQDNPNA